MAGNSPFKFFTRHIIQADRALVRRVISRSYLTYRDDNRGKPLGRQTTRLKSKNQKNIERCIERSLRRTFKNLGCIPSPPIRELRSSSNYVLSKSFIEIVNILIFDEQFRV